MGNSDRDGGAAPKLRSWLSCVPGRTHDVLLRFEKALDLDRYRGLRIEFGTGAIATALAKGAAPWMRWRRLCAASSGNTVLM